MTLPRPHRVDLLMAVGGLAIGLLMWSFGLHTQTGRLISARWATLIPLFVMASMVALRRTRPLTALHVGTVALVADQFTYGTLVTALMFTDLVYAAVVYGTPAAARRIPYLTGLITIGVTIGFLVWFQNAIALVVGLITGMVSFLPALTGAVVRNHRQAADAALLRAEQTALLAEMDRTQAVVAERARMARELHDMVANHLSAIAIHSTAAMSIDEPATTRQALTVIRENSVAGLSEMRRLIGLLRDSGGDSEPAAAPTLAGLDALVDQARANARPSGLVLVLADSRESTAGVPAPVELAAYRIVQESLTNALKHAAPGEVRVVLTGGHTALTVEVTSPLGVRPGPTAPGSGAGLVGMRERVDLLGGGFEAGPVADGDGRKRWQVRAELPMDVKDEERA
ncbi:histidine kinase [Streptomyces sp. MBT42]|uniref:sensor histidine kinase n=1 Tax=Streptomyces sp. MBT42 TaxID=1488373 RepID=UPI001E4664C8|nr:histidine kinase [Streptomyces sp. MBT42]MCD2464376.1 histidine kinase [Streptomyces sp. MBT42]